ALLRWLLHDGDIPTMMTTPQAAGPLDFDERWGLGLGVGHAGLNYAGRVAWHTGRTFGHRAALALLPERGLGVAGLANFRGALRVDQLAVTARQAARLARGGVDVPPSRGDAEVPPPAPVDAATARAYSGQYAADYDVITLASAGDVMRSRSDHGETRLL